MLFCLPLKYAWWGFWFQNFHPNHDLQCWLLVCRWNPEYFQILGPQFFYRIKWLRLRGWVRLRQFTVDILGFGKTEKTLKITDYYCVSLTIKIWVDQVGQFYRKIGPRQWAAVKIHSSDKIVPPQKCALYSSSFAHWNHGLNLGLLFQIIY